MATEGFESNDEFKHIEKDLDDRIRHEIAWEINRYVRRLKDDAISTARAELKRRGIEKIGRQELKDIADRAVTQASEGMFIEMVMSRDDGLIEQ